jgi:protein involved in temperature-dependent protein secretion
MTVEDIKKNVGKFLAEGRMDEAINVISAYLKEYPDDKQVAALLEQILTIVKYNNRDIYAATNLDMDPWEE